MHKAQKGSPCVQGEAKHNLCSLSKDQWVAARNRGAGSKEGERVSVLGQEVFPPHKFSLYHQFLDMVALIQSLIQNQKDCHEVNASCSSSALLRINSEAGP